MYIAQIIRRAFARAVLFTGLLAVPLMAIPAVNAGSEVTIEAPAAKKMGAGLVIMVSLQRNQ